MKRLHVHLGVENLSRSVDFYAALFGAPPTVRKDDYAKWMLDDPCVNFAISTRGEVGLDHLGMQVESGEELRAAAGHLAAAGNAVIDQTDAFCCYARSDKAWVADPQGIAWETFFSHGEATVYGEDRREPAAASSACCAPKPELTAKSVCGPSAETISADIKSIGDKPAACCG